MPFELAEGNRRLQVSDYPNKRIHFPVFGPWASPALAGRGDLMLGFADRPVAVLGGVFAIRRSGNQISPKPARPTLRRNKLRQLKMESQAVASERCI